MGFDNVVWGSYMLWEVILLLVHVADGELKVEDIAG